MKILYIAHRINSSDGSSVHGRAFVHSVLQLGHEIKTFPHIQDITPKFPKSLSKNPKKFLYYLKKLNLKTLIYYTNRLTGYNFNLLSMIDGLIDSIKHYRYLKTFIEKYNPDIIIYRHLLYDFTAFWISVKYGIPTLVEVNALKLIENKLIKKNKCSHISKWAELKTIKSFDHYFVVSKEIKKLLDYYIDPSKSNVIPNGVDTEKFNPDIYDKDFYKNILNLKGKTVLGYVGSYKNWHGLDISIDIIEKLSRKDQNFHLLLVGDGHYYQSIKELISKKRLNDFVTQTGNIFHEEIPKYMAVFDYALMTYPSSIESFYFSPLKMFEYMAMRIPVVATDIGQVGEIITDNHTGFLVYPPTPENFVRAIIDGQDNMDKIAMNSRKLMIDKYSWISNAKKVIEICSRFTSAK